MREVWSYCCPVSHWKWQTFWGQKWLAALMANHNPITPLEVGSKDGPFCFLVTLLTCRLSDMGMKIAHCCFTNTALLICYDHGKFIFLERYTQTLRTYLITIVNIQFIFIFFSLREREKKIINWWLLGGFLLIMGNLTKDPWNIQLFKFALLQEVSNG